MTRQWIVALSLGAALSACAPQTVQRAEPGTIRFAVDSTPFPPFATRDAAGKWTGFEVDLMDAVCAEMKAKCVVAPTPWDALIAKLQAGDIDVIWASMTVTEERRRVIDFTDIYYNTPMIILAAKSSIIDPARPETLKGKRIVALTYQVELAKKTFGPAAEIVPVDLTDGEELDATMTRARADAILIDRSLTDRFLKSPRGAVYAVKWTAPWNLAATAGVAAGLRKSDADLKARLNTALKAVRQSGRFKQIQDRYFDYEISGM